LDRAGLCLAGGAGRRRLAEGWFRSLITDGLIAGVGAVIVFLPLILILFLFILVLEASGYMVRAAFLMDRLMAQVGLSGAPSSRCCPPSPARCRASWRRGRSMTRRTG
jgi:Fe2+ transport system protein B